MTVVAGGAGASAALTAAALAAAVGGSLEGDGTVEVTRVAALDLADGASLSFFSGRRYAAEAMATRAAAVLVTPDLAPRVTHVRARIVVDAPQEAMLIVLPLLHPERAPVAAVHASATIGKAELAADVVVGAGAVIADGARIGARSRIGAGVSIGEGATIGADCLIHPNVSIYAHSVLGDRVIIHSGAVIGGDGFGYVFTRGAHQKIPHVGRAVLESDVEIGANTTIDRGSVGDTVVGAGTKIDNLVQVGHNVRIGRLCLIMSQSGISGSTRLGDGVVIAGQVGLVGHITVGDGARIGGQACVMGDVPAGETWSGYPARPHREALRTLAAAAKLPALLKSLGSREGRE